MLYLAFGLGSGWTLVDALMIEVARMGQTQPEGLALATIMGTASTVGGTVVVPAFFWLQRRLQWPLSRWVWLALVGQALSAIIGAGFWNATWHDTSPALYALGFLSSFAGNFQQLAVVPWVQEGGTEPSAVSWTMAGSNLGAVVCAIFGAIQKPGAPDQRFSVGTFFVMVLLLVVMGMAAFATLLRRRAEAARAASLASLSRAAAPPEAIRHGHDGTTSRRDAQQSDLVVRRAKGSGCGKACKSAGCTHPRGWVPWFATHPHVLRVTAVNAMLQLICWIFLRSLMPYACAHAASKDGSDEGAARAHADQSAGELQGYVVEASLVTVFIGAALSAYVPNKAVRLTPTLVAELLPLATLTAISAGWHPFDSSAAAKATLVLAATVARFTDGLVSPLLYRVVGDPFPETERQAVTQWAGVVAIVVGTLGTWVTFVLVSTGVMDMVELDDDVVNGTNATLNATLLGGGDGT